MNAKSKSVKSMAKSRQEKSDEKPRRSKAVEKAKPAEDGFDFVGKVESLRVKSGGAAGAFEFGLRGRGGKRRSFMLDGSDPIAMNAMAQILVAAHASEAKIGVRADAGEGTVLVRELECRPKLGKG